MTPTAGNADSYPGESPHSQDEFPFQSRRFRAIIIQLMPRRSWIWLAGATFILTALNACILADYTLPQIETASGGAGGETNANSSSGGGIGMDASSSTGGKSSSSSNTGGAGGAGGTGGAGNASGGAGGAGNDASSSSTGMGGMPPVAFCDPKDDTLLACFQFNGDFDDHSGRANPVTITEMSFASGKDGEGANFQVDKASSLTMPSAEHWNVTEYTAELWFNVRSIPLGTERMGLVDSNGRWGLFLYANGEVRCSRNGTTAYWFGASTNTWTHVACVLANDTLSIFINGRKQMSTSGVVNPLPNMEINALGGDAPSGDVVDGILDSVRIWNKPRTDKEICEAAGLLGC